MLADHVLIYCLDSFAILPNFLSSLNDTMILNFLLPSTKSPDQIPNYVTFPGIRETPVEPAKSKPVMIERAKFIFKFERSKQGRPAFLSNRRFSYAWISRRCKQHGE